MKHCAVDGKPTASVRRGRKFSLKNSRSDCVAHCSVDAMRRGNARGLISGASSSTLNGLCLKVDVQRLAQECFHCQ